MFVERLNNGCPLIIWTKHWHSLNYVLVVGSLSKFACNFLEYIYLCVPNIKLMWIFVFCHGLVDYRAGWNECEQNWTKNQYLSKTELLEALKPFVVPRSSASRMLMKIETNGHALHTGKSAAGLKRATRSEPNRSALLSSTSNKIGVSVHFLAKKQDKNKSCIHQSLKEGLN